ncbi:MAG: threonine synthase [Rhizobiales bacterium]|nr:threonine synthase [Hyphomicrobiales bacterium]
MRYISTRGTAPELSFADAALSGLARDGGLYVPASWPKLDAVEIEKFADLSYVEIACRVLAPFMEGSISDAELKDFATHAYATFSTPEVAPLVQIGDKDWLMELFHGPTLAFKDVAMQFLARLIDHLLQQRGGRITIIGATSGDTGAAAVQAFRGSEAIDIFMLHPKGRVSPVQRRQMTTALEPNVHNIEIDGTFDDCQTIVKHLFQDLELRDELSLSGINSINWARVVVQAVYYFSGAAALGVKDGKVAFSVPTGNFGDIYAGYIANRMGLKMDRLLLATNVNDILVRTLATGRYELNDVVATHSPSMDIQIASNFERLLFDTFNRDPARINAAMTSLAENGIFSLDDAAISEIRSRFAGFRADEAETLAMIRDLHARMNYQADPHTAVGLVAARKAREQGVIADDVSIIALATAHPAKFPDAMVAATGIKPELPDNMNDIYKREEKCASLPNDADAVASFMREHAAILGTGISV